MSDTPLLLTIVLESPGKIDRESVLYRRLLAARLKSEHLFAIQHVSQPLTTADIVELCGSAKSKYVVFLRSSHEVSGNYLTTLLQYLKSRTVYIAEPWSYKGSIPKNVAATSIDNKYFFSRDSDVYGVAYNTGRLADVLEAMSDIDRTGIYLSYRLYWSINAVQRLKTGFSTASDHQAVNGIQLDQATTRMFPLIPSTSIELRLAVTRYMALFLRGARVAKTVPVGLDHLREVVRTLGVDRLLRYVESSQPFEAAWISWLAQSRVDRKLYKQLSGTDAYLDFLDGESLQESDVPLYELRFGSDVLRVGKSYRACSERPGFADPANYDFYGRPVHADSTILFFDRPMNADDNAEHLYEYFMVNHPEYTEAYFALNPKSADWARLEARGFKLVRMFSPEFYEKFLISDLVISSQIYNLRHKGKNLANSRFVYLQHGIQLNDMTEWVLSKNFDVFVATGKIEADYLGKLAPKETLNSGLPRLESLARREGENRVLLFMPTWRLNLHQASEEQFKKSHYFRAIDSLLRDPVLLDFLERTNRMLHVKLHPNVGHRASLFQFSERIVNSELSYREAFELAEGVFTDFSSAVLDASFIGTPIAYYQWDAEEFFMDQAYESRLDYRTEGLGPVFTAHSEFIEHVVQEHYLEEKEEFSLRRERFFEGVDPLRINARIVERMLSL